MIIGSNILHFENLPSTNTFASGLAGKKDVKEGTVIQTNYQSAGRGNGSNKWESKSDKNLLFSIILYPSMLMPDQQFLISMTITLGICDFLTDYTSFISVKWPNDIYVKDDKIAGILIENSVMGNSLEHSVAGIGLNINQEKFPENIPNPVSLFNLTGIEYDLEGCLVKLLRHLDRRYKCLIAGESEPIGNDYRKLLWRKGIWSRYSDRRGSFEGKLTDVTEGGLLCIERKDGSTAAYSFKEINFIL